MKKSSITLLLSLLVLTILASCKETEVTGEYDNWQQRNETYIDGIAATARANADGQWHVYRSFKLPGTDVDGNVAQWDNEDYIYCHVEQEGTGTASPLFTDTVLVNYRGRLMPSDSYPEGYIFDQSYKGQLTPQFNSPYKFCVGGVVVGWSTALMKMHAGDTWRVYIPANLGYGMAERTSDGIPAYSALVFDINLVSFSPVGTPVTR